MKDAVLSAMLAFFCFSCTKSEDCIVFFPSAKETEQVANNLFNDVEKAIGDAAQLKGAKITLSEARVAVVNLLTVIVKKGTAKYSEEFQPFLAEMVELASQNLKDKRQFFDRIKTAINAQAGQDPFFRQQFFEELINSFGKADPGLAIQLESFASESMRAEMARLRLESGVSALLEKDKTISQLYGQLVAAEKANAELSKKITETEKVVSVMNSRVPVLLVNTWNSTLAVFKITSDTTGKVFTYTVDDAEGAASNRGIVYGKMEIYLEPGDYFAEIYEGRKAYAKSNCTVAIKPIQEKYHLVITTPN